MIQFVCFLKERKRSLTNDSDVKVMTHVARGDKQMGCTLLPSFLLNNKSNTTWCLYGEGEGGWRINSGDDRSSLIFLNLIVGKGNS